MARSKASKSKIPAPIEEEKIIDTDAPVDEGAGVEAHVEAAAGDEGTPEEGDPATDAGTKSVTKAQAARAALEHGYESPQEAVAFILREFSIDMLPQHFSAVKSQLRKKERLAEDGPAAPSRRGRRPSSHASFALPSRRSNGGEDFDVLDAMEAIKPLVDQLGADRVKRIVDLLG